MYNSAILAENIKNTAKQKNITLKNMLTECALGVNAISHLYHGRVIASDSLAKIADYLNVSVDYLLTGKITSEKDLSDDERILLEKFRNLDSAKRAAIETLLK